MSVQSEITRISSNIASAYSAAAELNAEMPETQNSDNLAATILTIRSYSDTGLTLTDHTTGTKYVLYVDNGKLTLEEGVEAGDDITLVDRTTGIEYVLYVDNGKLSMGESVY